MGNYIAFDEATSGEPRGTGSAPIRDRPFYVTY